MLHNKASWIVRKTSQTKLTEKVLLVLFLSFVQFLFDIGFINVPIVKKLRKNLSFFIERFWILTRNYEIFVNKNLADINASSLIQEKSFLSTISFREIIGVRK